MSVQDWENYAAQRIRTRNGDLAEAWLDVFNHTVTITTHSPARPSIRSLGDALRGFLAAKSRLTA